MRFSKKKSNRGPEKTLHIMEPEADDHSKWEETESEHEEHNTTKSENARETKEVYEDHARKTYLKK